MNIRVNGRPEKLEGASDVAGLIARKGLSADRVVVEHNRKVLPMDRWAGTHLCEDDDIEIVSFVGGG